MCSGAPRVQSVRVCEGRRAPRCKHSTPESAAARPALIREYIRRSSPTAAERHRPAAANLRNTECAAGCARGPARALEPCREALPDRSGEVRPKCALLYATHSIDHRSISW